MRISDWSSDVCSSDLPEYDAIPPDVRRAGGLLRLRKELRVFATLRPVVGYEALGDIVSLKPVVIRGVDVMIVRELNGGRSEERRVGNTWVSKCISRWEP